MESQQPSHPSNDIVPALKHIFWRCALGGVLIYLALGPSQVQNLRMNAAAFILCVIWCYYDGAFSRWSWQLSWLEGTSWYLISILVAKVLIAFFGLPGPAP